MKPHTLLVQFAARTKPHQAYHLQFSRTPVTFSIGVPTHSPVRRFALEQNHKTTLYFSARTKRDREWMNLPVQLCKNGEVPHTNQYRWHTWPLSHARPGAVNPAQVLTVTLQPITLDMSGSKSAQGHVVHRMAVGIHIRRSQRWTFSPQQCFPTCGPRTLPALPGTEAKSHSPREFT